MRNCPTTALLLAAALAVSGGFLGAEPAIADTGDQPEDPANYGEVGILIEYEDRADKTGHLDLGAISRGMASYLRMKEHWAADTGLNFILEISPQYQNNLDGDGGIQSNNETNLIGQWALVDKADPGRGNLMFWYQWSSTIGGKTTSEFMDRMDVLSPPNGGDTAPGENRDLTQLFAWEQRFADDQYRVMVGKLTTRVLFNLNRYAVGDRDDFFTPMLVNNPVVDYTARIGVGLFGELKREGWYLSGMVRDADADLSDRFIDFSSLDSGNWEYLGEFGLVRTGDDTLGKGYYRFTASRTDEIGNPATGGTPSSTSFSMSFDQDIGERVGAFMRYAWADDTFRTFDKRFALGLQLKQPLGFSNDRIGVGAWWGDPTDSALDPEYGLDLFWKVQLTPYLEVSPGMQIIFDPALSRGDDRATLAQLRLRLLL